MTIDQPRPPGRRLPGPASRVRGVLPLMRAIDRLSDVLGRSTAWLTLGMVLLGAYNAVARYAGRFTGMHLGSNAYLEAQWYLFSLVFLFAAAWTLRGGAHVRVDVVWGRLPDRARTWVDLAGLVLLYLPFCSLLLVTSWPSVRNSWAVLEVSPDPGGLPRYPLKAAMLLAFGLLWLQGVAEGIRCWGRLAGALPSGGPARDGGGS